MALSTQPYKGARDFYPEDKRLQKYMFAKWRQVAESFGYEEYDAPILEPLEIYKAKTGEEIVNEQTYCFEDRGGRAVVVRPEMTPTVSRMVAAKRQELGYPLRWYSIPNLWRYERPQRGRLREHWQLNVDLFGVEGISAETELIKLIDAVFKAFGASNKMYTIKLNSRKLMDSVMSDYLELDAKAAHKISKLIDKMHKMDKRKFIAAVDQALSPKQLEAGVTEKLMVVLETDKLSRMPITDKSKSSASELQTTIADLKTAGITNVEFDPTLMRGFDYYTDVIFEVFDTDADNNRAMLGGGRYDGLVGLFGVKPVPTVGFGWGDVTLANFLKVHHLLPDLKPETDVYVALVGDVLASAQQAIDQLRASGLSLAVDLSGKKLSDQLKTADKKGIDKVLIIGESELQTGILTVKNLKTGKEVKAKLSEIAKSIK